MIIFYGGGGDLKRQQEELTVTCFTYYVNFRCGYTSTNLINAQQTVIYKSSQLIYITYKGSN